MRGIDPGGIDSGGIDSGGIDSGGIDSGGIDCVELEIYQVKDVQDFPNRIRITSLELTEKAKQAFGLRRDLDNEQETIKES